MSGLQEELAGLEKALQSGTMPPTGVVVSIIKSLRSLAVTVDKLEDRADFDRRREALAAAAEFVNAQPAQQPNERGYRDSVLAGEKLITEQLRVARYLMGKELWESGCTRSSGTA